MLRANAYPGFEKDVFNYPRDCCVAFRLMKEGHVYILYLKGSNAGIRNRKRAMVLII